MSNSLRYLYFRMLVVLRKESSSFFFYVVLIDHFSFSFRFLEHEVMVEEFQLIEINVFIISWIKNIHKG